MEEQMMEMLRRQAPLIHCITNYVTVNDVANMILAAGASPIMADGIYEVEDVTSICNGLVINIGTLNERTIESMIKAGRQAEKLGHPIIFDPVGAGASAFRRETAKQILSELSCTVIRGNVSEIKTIARELGISWTGDSNLESQGVDAHELDVVTEENLEQMCGLVREVSRRTGAVTAVTGKIDLVADEKQVYVIRNGHPMIARVTGTGCMLDGVVAAFVCAHKDQVLKAAAMAVAAEGICGELAYERVAAEGSGSGSFRMYLMDFMSQMDDEQLRRGRNIEIR